MISEVQYFCILEVRKRAKIRNLCNQLPLLTQDTNEKVTTLQLDITNNIIAQDDKFCDILIFVQKEGLIFHVYQAACRKDNSYVIAIGCLTLKAPNTTNVVC